MESRARIAHRQGSRWTDAQSPKAKRSVEARDWIGRDGSPGLVETAVRDWWRRESGFLKAGVPVGQDESLAW
ncbi:hypothetical protein chiPu_0025139 [Chiloscyllium punctatum]|uniref:Uncharacterized protein n=1 Tax=Chiloscyllium punctatum TaxID=137246 RepID=A0A401TEX4_CHIPU|nr:hypothetical protein [Chiloscyllium punctatum]